MPPLRLREAVFGCVPAVFIPLVKAVTPKIAICRASLAVIQQDNRRCDASAVQFSGERLRVRSATALQRSRLACKIGRRFEWRMRRLDCAGHCSVIAASKSISIRLDQMGRLAYGKPRAVNLLNRR